MEHEVAPSDCCLAVAVPLWGAWAEEALARRWPGSFMDGCVGTLATTEWARFWEEYRRRVAAPVWDAIREVRVTGANVVMATHRTLASALARHKVVMVIAHSLDDATLELADSPMSIEVFTSLIPREVGGVVDLACCGSGFVLGRLKRDRPKWMFCGNTGVLSPAYCAVLFAKLMFVLARYGPALYTDANFLLRQHLISQLSGIASDQS